MDVVDKFERKFGAAEGKVHGGRNTGGDRNTDRKLWQAAFAAKIEGESDENYVKFIVNSMSLFNNKPSRTMPDSVELGKRARTLANIRDEVEAGSPIFSTPSSAAALAVDGALRGGSSVFSCEKQTAPQQRVRVRPSLGKNVPTTTTQAAPSNIDLDLARGEADEPPGIKGDRGIVEELEPDPADAADFAPEYAGNAGGGEAGHEAMSAVADTMFMAGPPQQPNPFYAPSARDHRSAMTAKSRAAHAAEAELLRRQAAATSARKNGEGGVPPTDGSQFSAEEGR